MERLTYDFCVGGQSCWEVRGADNLICEEVCENQGDKGCEDCPIQKAIDRLAAYEDTGLTPEEIITLKSIKSWADAVEHELEKYTQAEKEGRLVTLPPIKIGDTAFFIINKRIYEGKVYYMRWEHHKSFGVRGDISADSFGGCVGARLFDFGKTVFLSKENAEAALKEQEG